MPTLEQRSLEFVGGMVLIVANRLGEVVGSNELNIVEADVHVFDTTLRPAMANFCKSQGWLGSEQ